MDNESQYSQRTRYFEGVERGRKKELTRLRDELAHAQQQCEAATLGVYEGRPGASEMKYKGIEIVWDPMGPKALGRALQKLRDEDGRDAPADHIKADALLVRELRALGYRGAMEIYVDIGKWFE